ncbi:odorant receptor 85c-like isoform X2 [Photinus pyralis]|uniref:odorant receptor 85c-like isoform X2 n=1 Tax=Photinus pyralis TaxID=7054 RepID=UPI0012673EE6|nr:odorant receptor 85c-like isoform X2 [Photinus pyralis]
MIMYTFGIFIGFAKTLIIVRNRLKIGRMMDKLEEEPFTLNRKRGGDEEEALIKKCIWITNAQEDKCGPVKICDPTGQPIVQWKYLNQTLKETIRYHMAILDMADEMEELCSGLLLFVFISTLGMLCFIIYRASTLPFTDTQVLRNLFEGMSIALQVLIICFWGQEVANESESVAHSILESNFAGTDLRFQRALQLAMLRSQRATALTAGKFTSIGLPTFAWIMRTSYSAYMVVYNKNTKEE